jgi:N-acetylglucosaminyl-diphospho-decaprenol L-rhamnosyltransferase
LLAISLNANAGSEPLLQIVIVAYNSADVLQQCLSSVAKSIVDCHYLVTVFDNASDQSCRELCENQPGLTLTFVENAVNVGFGRANNSAVSLTNSKYVLLLNPDAIVEKSAIANALGVLQSTDDVAIVGGSLFAPDGHPEPSARFSPTVWSMFAHKIGLRAHFGNGARSDTVWNRESLVECDWVPGCFYLFRRALIKEVGLFDPRYFLYYEEVDHCKRTREFGYKVVCSPTVKVEHIGGASAETVATITKNGRQISALQIESELLFLRKHFGLIGLSTHLGLSIFACFVVLSKALIKQKNLSRFTAMLADTKSMVSLCFLTSFGQKAIH